MGSSDLTCNVRITADYLSRDLQQVQECMGLNFKILVWTNSIDLDTLGSDDSWNRMQRSFNREKMQEKQNKTDPSWTPEEHWHHNF